MQLVVNSPGTFITQKEGCFRLKNKDKVFDVSPVKVESIVLSNQVMISTQAVVQALENNIDIIFLDGYGDPLGRIWFSKLGSTRPSFAASSFWRLKTRPVGSLCWR